MAESKSAALPLGYAPRHRRIATADEPGGGRNIAVRSWRINDYASIDARSAAYNNVRCRHRGHGADGIDEET
jgi:hypothetical protein